MANINKLTNDELIMVSLLVDKILLFNMLSECLGKSTSEISDHLAERNAKFLLSMTDSKAREYIDQARKCMDNVRHK